MRLPEEGGKETKGEKQKGEGLGVAVVAESKHVTKCEVGADLDEFQTDISTSGGERLSVWFTGVASPPCHHLCPH